MEVYKWLSLKKSKILVTLCTCTCTSPFANTIIQKILWWSLYWQKRPLFFYHRFVKKRHCEYVLWIMLLVIRASKSSGQEHISVEQVRDEQRCVHLILLHLPLLPSPPLPSPPPPPRDDNTAPFSQIHCLKKVVTDGPTNGPTDGRTKPLIEMRGRI